MLKWNKFSGEEIFFEVADKKTVNVWKYDDSTKNVTLLKELKS